MRYSLVAGAEALDFVIRCPTGERQHLSVLLFTLASSPFQEGDYSEKDDTGRIQNVMVQGPYVVTFWADHFAKELRIVRIERVKTSQNNRRNR